MYDLILHPEYEALLKEIEGLKGDIVAIRTRMDHVVAVEVPLYKGEYNHYFGLLEHEVAQKYYRYCLLKRKLEMIQAALNRGAEPDMDSINEILEAEADEYNDLLARKMAEIKATVSVEFGTMEKKEAAQAKELYQKIVRALHPDLNPDATDDDLENLQQAVEAFASGDVATLEAVATVLELGGKLNPQEKCGSMEELRERRDHLTETAKNLARQLKVINQNFPMNQKALLLDKTLINEKIEMLKQQSAQYDELLDSYIQRIAPYEQNNVDGPSDERNVG